MPTFRTPFYYYGAKGKLAHLYPAPTYPLIIEPFCGSAAYSWFHHEGHEVWVNDLDPRTFSIWEFLTNPVALKIVRHHIPEVITAGERVSDLLAGQFNQIGGTKPLWYDGLLELLRAAANVSTQGAKGVHDQVTFIGAKCWPRMRTKMEVVIPAVQGWTVTNMNYHQLPDIEATWFIDPPYSNPAGARYRTGGLDYNALAAWCRSRKGQVIVCENAGATWGDFQPIDHPRVSIRSRYQKADAKEVVWIMHNTTQQEPALIHDIRRPIDR